MTPTPQDVARAYREGRYAEGQALNRAVGIARKGTPQSGGAVTNSARRDGTGGRIALGERASDREVSGGRSNREVPEPGAVGRRAARRLPATNADPLGPLVDLSLPQSSSSAERTAPGGSANSPAIRESAGGIGPRVWSGNPAASPTDRAANNKRFSQPE